MSSQPQPDRKLVLYFQVHQPKRLSTLNFFDIGSSGNYFNTNLNTEILRRVAKQCYLPANAVLLKALKKHPELKVTFSISGVTLDQFEQYAPEVIDSFKRLVETGSVEFLGETYYHSLASMMQSDEFEAQVVKHAEKIFEHFQVRPHVFRNTELIYDNEIGKRISMLGYDGVITEGTDAMMKKHGINNVHHHPTVNTLKLLLRNYRLSDDIAFRYKDFNLTADKFLSWLRSTPKNEQVVTLGMDYETFGEHHKQDGGIQKFLEQFLNNLSKQKDFQMVTPTEAVRTLPSLGAIDVPKTISWADQERDLSAWLGNDMQRDSFYTVTRMEQSVKSMADPNFLDVWRCLLTSDHFYYMSTKKNADGSVHTYFSPFPSPYEAFINYMNVIADFSIHAKAAQEASLEKASTSAEHERQKQNENVPTWAVNYDQDHHTPYRH